MIDPIKLIQRRLTDPAGPVLAALGNQSNIFGGHLPVGFNPSVSGEAIVVRGGTGSASVTGGGSAHLYAPMITPRMQVTVWSGKEIQDFERARAIYGVIFDWLHFVENVDLAPDGFIQQLYEMTEGQDVTDPETKYATVVSFWALHARAS